MSNYEVEQRRLKRWFDRTGNYLYAWESYLVAREVGGHAPAWAREYIDDIATKLVNDDDIDRSKRRWAQDLLRLNPGKGGTDPFNEYYDREYHEAVASDVAVEIAARRGLIPDDDDEYAKPIDPRVKESAINDVSAKWTKDGRFGPVSAEEVRYWYEKYAEQDARKVLESLEEEERQRDAEDS